MFIKETEPFLAPFCFYKVANSGSNTNLIALHPFSDRKINYQEEHYLELAHKTRSFAEKNISARAKENLKAIGAVYE